MHHGSESKRLRSMENRRPRSRTQQAGVSPHSSHSAERQAYRSREGLGLQKLSESLSGMDSHTPRSKRSYLPETGYGRNEFEQDENMAEGSYVEQLLSPGNARFSAAQVRDVTPKPRSILMTPGGRPKKVQREKVSTENKVSATE